MKRRNVLLGVGTSILSGAVLSTSTTASSQADTEASITFSNQTTEGTTVTVDRIKTDVTARFRIRDLDSNSIAGPLRFEAGTDVEDYEVELNTPITESQHVSANLYNSDGQNIAREVAKLTVEDPPELVSGIDPTLIESNSDAGFNYPYYLFAPTTVQDAEPKPVLAEPVNQPRTSDDFDYHLAQAEDTVKRGTGRRLAEGLSSPFIVPVFPRPQSDPVDNLHLVNALDTTTLEIADGPLERVDKQLLAMVEDARKQLQERDYPVADGLLLNGFSASGNFVDRFSALYPDEVTSVTAGGLNGMPILPISETINYSLDYHVGVANIGELTGRSFDVDAFSNVNRFLYMGEFDDSDTIPYSDAFNDELREIAVDVFGAHMIEDRFPVAKSIYDDIGTASVFRMYEGSGHSPPAIGDLVEFHERSLAGEDVETIRADLGGNVPQLGAHIEYGPQHPEVGEEITFNGGRSAIRNAEIAEFKWEFGDARTTYGETASHTFDTKGGHNVSLTVTDSAGNTYSTTIQLAVGTAYPLNAETTSVRFDDQDSQGTAITIAKISTDVAARLVIKTTDRTRVAKPFRLTAGDVVEDFHIELQEPLSETTSLTAALRSEKTGQIITTETATITVAEQPTQIEGLGPKLISADSDAGFNYPYYLYAPSTIESADARPILAEPVNTGSATDDFQQHLSAGKGAIEGTYGSGRLVANQVRTPFIVPVFPRPQNDPVDWTHYVHALDATTMAIEQGPLERVDLQFLNMVEDARARLTEEGYPVSDGLLLNGFSASGNFVERFASLHPTEVTAVTAGGLNGMPLLPTSSAKTTSGDTVPVNYHVGIRDVPELTGDDFDVDAFSEVNRFLFLGDRDMNDTISYDDAFTTDALRDTALAVFGRNMQEDRFPYARSIYDAIGAATVFRMYEGTAHSDRPALNDIIEFHRRSLQGEDVTELQANLGGNSPNKRASISFAPQTPLVNHRVTFHAGETVIRDGDPTKFEWSIGEETRTGESISYSFTQPGHHAVTLTVTDTTGSTHRATEYVPVAQDADSLPAPELVIGNDASETPEDTPRPPVIVGDSPPTDPNGDGQFEDINGDGTADIADVQALFSNFDSDSIQNNVGAFDFNDDEKINILDVQAFFKNLI